MTFFKPIHENPWDRVLVNSRVNTILSRRFTDASKKNCDSASQWQESPSSSSWPGQNRWQRSFDLGKQKDPLQRVSFRELLVPKEGLEPSWDCSHYALNVARLPIPPLRHFVWRSVFYLKDVFCQLATKHDHWNIMRQSSRGGFFLAKIRMITYCSDDAWALWSIQHTNHHKTHLFLSPVWNVFSLQSYKKWNKMKSLTSCI